MIKKRKIGKERRDFIRLSYRKPLMYKVCKKSTIYKIMQGYARNISNSGLMCNLNERVSKGNILWLRLDSGALGLCKDIERNSVIIQQGVFGKVVWQKKLPDLSYDIGVRFLTRQEKSAPGIFLTKAKKR
ncbi:MAG: PilZ domain-containing protein [Candidatus Omnitrophota bacterium]